MRAKLVECLAADAASTAVLEEKNGALARLGDRGLELGGIR
jgi:hypothetical protein